MVKKSRLSQVTEKNYFAVAYLCVFNKFFLCAVYEVFREQSLLELK